MKKKQLKKIEDIGKRALKTFFQAFISSLCISMGNLSTIDKTLVKSALIGALASGLSALMNYLNNVIAK